MVLLPLAPAFAADAEVIEVALESESNESDVASVETLPEEVAAVDEVSVVQDNVSKAIDELPPENEVPEIQNPESVDDSYGDVVLEEELIDENTASDELSTTSSEILAGGVSIEEDTSDEVTATSSDDTSDGIETVPEITTDIDAEVLTEPNSEDTDEDSISEDETATATPEIGEVVSANVVTTDENRFSFAKGECASVGDEMFYCAKADTATTTTHTDRVFAASDAEGDKEIYIEKDGVVAAISNNSIDDDAPYYDALSDTIVWHRLIEGRYQIISYDIDREEETQLTSDRYNNMAPSRYDNLTVWQGWVGNDWEIFTLLDNELMMITDNTTHDIAPSVNGTHIIWQSFETGVWQMKVYDIRTKQVSTIEDTDGGSVENPRFVLVYDTKFESGDVETRGYDLVSGEVVSLGALPASVPKEIPDPDQTGEKRALVSPQTQPKTKVDEGDDGDGVGGGDDLLPEDDITDIVIPALQGTSTESTFSEEVTDIEDVLIPAVATENASSTSHIEDIIITPFVEQISVPDDAQQVIVSGS
ncbi:MAG: hypothetical protein WAW13_04970 [Minisyncoccia bacterium]